MKSGAGLLAGLVLILAGAAAGEPPRGHAHNDYEHARPLLDALAHGFASIEADIWLVDDALLVAHDRDEVSPERTLQRLYLDPLRVRVRANGGAVYPRSGDAPAAPLILLIDIKSEAEPTFRRLHAVLDGYREMLTVTRAGEATAGAVTIVISGNRPIDLMRDQAVRLAAVDGRLSDLGRDALPALMPVISDRWPSHFSWRGVGVFPPAEREKLAALVERVHAEGRMLRLWATADTPAMWRELSEAGVDLINTDDLAGLAEFLRGR